MNCVREPAEQTFKALTIIGSMNLTEIYGRIWKQRKSFYNESFGCLRKNENVISKCLRKTLQGD